MATADPNPPAPDADADADTEMVERAPAQVFAPWVRELDLSVLRARVGDVTLALPVSARHVHGGGELCTSTYALL